MPFPDPVRALPADTARYGRLLRLRQAVTTIHEQLGAIREETQQLVAIEETRPLDRGRAGAGQSPGARSGRAVAWMQRLRGDVVEARRARRVGVS